MTNVRHAAGSCSDAVVRWVGIENLSGLEKRNIFLENEKYLVERALRGAGENKHAGEALLE